LTESDNGLRSLTNALRIIEAISSKQPIGVSDLSRAVGLPKSSVQRAAKTLEQAGWIRSAQGDQVRWELTSHMLMLSLRASGESLRDFAEPAMLELRQRTNETIHLVALDNDSGLVIHRLDSAQPVRAIVEVGTRPPLHASSSGQAILAYLPSDRSGSILAGELEACTVRTITDSAKLRERLTQVRRRGYAINVGEYRDEVASISCPVLTLDGSAVAAITISFPMSRFSDSVAESYGLIAKGIVDALGPFCS